MSCRAVPCHAGHRATRHPVTPSPVKPPRTGHLLRQPIPPAPPRLPPRQLRREPTPNTEKNPPISNPSATRRNPPRADADQTIPSSDKNSPQTLIQPPPPPLLPSPHARPSARPSARSAQTRAIRRPGQQPPTQRVYHPRDERVLRPDLVPRALLLAGIRRRRRRRRPRVARAVLLVRSVRGAVARARDLRPLRIRIRVRVAVPVPVFARAPSPPVVPVIALALALLTARGELPVFVPVPRAAEVRRRERARGGRRAARAGRRPKVAPGAHA